VKRVVRIPFSPLNTHSQYDIYIFYMSTERALNLRPIISVKCEKGCACAAWSWTCFVASYRVRTYTYISQNDDTSTCVCMLIFYLIKTYIRE
jgi:hypothetical protein